jgi:hypothetical protein
LQNHQLPSSSSGLPWSANRGAPSHGGAGDLGHKGLGELGKRGRRPRGTRGVAHLGQRRRRDGRRRTGMAAGSGSHGRRHSGGSPAMRNGASCSARHEETPWWHRFALGDGGCDESAAAALWTAARGSACSGGGASRAMRSRLGFAGSSVRGFIGARAAAVQGAHAKDSRPASPGRGGLWLGEMGLAGPGHRAGGRGSERVGPSGSAQTERIVFLFFSNLFLMPKQFLKNLEIV